LVSISELLRLQTDINTLKFRQGLMSVALWVLVLASLFGLPKDVSFLRALEAENA